MDQEVETIIKLAGRIGQNLRKAFMMTQALKDQDTKAKAQQQLVDIQNDIIQMQLEWQKIVNFLLYGEKKP